MAHINIEQNNFSNSNNTPTSNSLTRPPMMPQRGRRSENKSSTLNKDHKIIGQIPLTLQSINQFTPCQKKEMYVKALFDYDPNEDSKMPSKGLSFYYGDILHVLNASDQDWWLARHIINLKPNMRSNEGNQENQVGIIPSKRLVVRRERARNKKVNFSGKDYIIGSSQGDIFNQTWTSVQEISNEFDQNGSRQSLDEAGRPSAPWKKRSGIFKKFSSRLHRKGSYSLEANQKTGSLDALHEANSSASMGECPQSKSYEAVQSVERKVKRRPLVVLGPLKDRVNTELLKDSDVFSCCIPHTSKTCVEPERDGVDYHFVSSREEMQRLAEQGSFLEAGQIGEDYYGTSIEAVRHVANEEGKICVLDVSHKAVQKLNEAGLQPIVLLLMPESANRLCEVNRRINSSQANKAFEACRQLAESQWKIFTAIIPLNSFEFAVASVRHLVAVHHAQEGVWTSAPDSLLNTSPTHRNPKIGNGPNEGITAGSLLRKSPTRGQSVPPRSTMAR